MEQNSELFDLFGETAFCNVCCEDVKEGDRVRSLKDCQHTFHAGCIEKWFREKTICPTCRTIYIEPIEPEKDLLEDIERLFLTWTMIHGILKKLRTADQFNRNKENIKTICTIFTLLPVDLDSRHSFSIMKQYISNRISKISGIPVNRIHRQPQVYRWVDKIENHPRFAIVAPLWSF